MPEVCRLMYQVSIQEDPRALHANICHFLGAGYKSIFIPKLKNGKCQKLRRNIKIRRELVVLNFHSGKIEQSSFL